MPNLYWIGVLSIFCLCSKVLYAQSAPPSAQQLDQLLAPIALYPDALVAQITAASTNPQEILDADAWLNQNNGLQGTALVNAAQQKGFDPPFLALFSFPQVLNTMAQNIDDFDAIGQAFSANEGSVMDSIQRLRADAYASGALRSSSELQVIQQSQGKQQIIVIQAPNPQMVYVPQYDPAVVYAGPGPGAVASLITFGAGIAIGATLANNDSWGWGGWGWNWGGRSLLYNRGRWGRVNNRYRPLRPTYRPRPPRYSSKPGFGGRWSRPGNSSGYRLGSGNRPSPGNRPNPGNRSPSTNRPNPGLNRLADRPTSAPNARPAPATRPAVPNRNPYAGFQQGKTPAPSRQITGARPSAFGGSNGQAARAASARGKQSAGSAPRNRNR